MQVYQEIWIDKINQNKLEEVCQEIMADDTGGTDELTMILARNILAMKENCNANHK